jgi:hypothetical protein
MKQEIADPRGIPSDHRLLGKPLSNDDSSLPVMEYDWRELKLTSENIWYAQMAGWCRILTYDYVADKTARKLNRSQKRYESLTKAGVVSKPSLGWRDEYPFASTIENNGSVFVGHAPAEEQRKQAGILSAFYQKYGADSYTARTEKVFFRSARYTLLPRTRYAARYNVEVMGLRMGQRTFAVRLLPLSRSTSRISEIRVSRKT